MIKRMITIFLILALVIITGNALSQAAPLVEPKPPESLDYSYSYTSNFFKAGESVAFMDKHLFPLKVKAGPAGEEDVYISLFDLERIYAPDFKVSKDGTKFEVEHVGIAVKAAIDEKAIDVSGIAGSLPFAPSLIDGEICVPVAAFMFTAFAKDTKFQEGFVIVGHNQKKLDIPRRSRGMFGRMRFKLRGKKYGFIYRTYWFEEGNRTMTYRMYVPTTYDPKVPNKMLLLAHGASVNHDYWFSDTREEVRYYKPIEEYAEKYGYIIAAPTSFIKRGGYGDTGDILIMDQTRVRKLSDKQKMLRVLSGKCFMLGFEDVLKNYNIDKENIFLMGQSMGSLGALFMGNKYSERFKAVVCTGLMPNLGFMKANPYPNLVNKQVFFAYGTEDFSGFDFAQKNAAILDSYLNHFKTYWVPGGFHSTAWAQALGQIFDFLNKQ